MLPVVGGFDELLNFRKRNRVQLAFGNTDLEGFKITLELANQMNAAVTAAALPRERAGIWLSSSFRVVSCSFCQSFHAPDDPPP